MVNLIPQQEVPFTVPKDKSPPLSLSCSYKQMEADAILNPVGLFCF